MKQDQFLDPTKIDKSENNLKIISCPKKGGIGFILFLMIQNLIIFQGHYFHDLGFPWDFANSYYAMTAFWTTLVSQGTYPAWVPFYSMGMPFDLILQTGAHYPPLWIFPLLKIEYTLHAAVIVQCLHVLLGAIGMFFFLRTAFQSIEHANAYAFLGAFVFQFFGGFYSNAQHVDIVRAFAFAPWLLFFFTASPMDTIKAGWRFYFIPVVLLLLTTGGYPGNLVSSTVVIGLYFLFQIIDLWRHGSALPAILRFSFLIFFVSLIGVGLSFYHLGPLVFNKDFLVRSEQIGNFTGMATLKIEHFPAFFLENTLVPGQISMTSSYVSLPILILVSMISLKSLKQHWPVAAVSLFSFLMAFGPGSFLWFMLTKILPPLQYSRFPSSDYRIFIAIGLIYFALQSLKSLTEGGLDLKTLAIRSGFVLLWLFQGVYVSYPNLRSVAVYQTVSICFATILFIGFIIFYERGHPGTLFLTASVFLALISLDAIKVLSNMAFPQPQGSVVSTWQVASMSRLYETLGWPLNQNGHLLTYQILQNTPQIRPARIQKGDPTDYAWEGFIDGIYTLNNYKSPNMLNSTSLVLDDPLYKQFMLKEWTPLYFNSESLKTGEGNIQISPKEIKAKILSAENSNLNQVRQIRYGINEIEYNVTLDQPILMVENEMFFPGWTADLASNEATTVIEVVSVNNLFRAWLLPAGKYKFFAHFEIPNVHVYNGVSIAALAIWIFLLGRSGILSIIKNKK